MIWTAARKSASCSMKSTATPKSVITRLRAAWTGLREVTTPNAPTRITAAEAAKTRMSGQVGRDETRSKDAWSIVQALPRRLHLLPVARRALLGPPDASLHAAVGQGDVLIEQVALEHLAQRL